MKSFRRWKILILLVLGIALAALPVAGCGEGEAPSPGPNYERALAGAPPPLAGLLGEANELLPGGLEAFDERVQSGLAGYPVVVNVWASWCGPCRAEFPHFQKVSAEMGKRIAFLGVNSQDNDDAALTFLSTHPVPYPSYSDPDKKIAESLEARFGLPATAFFNSEGELTYTKSGPYASEAELEADIEKHAVKGETG